MWVQWGMLLACVPLACSQHMHQFPGYEFSGHEYLGHEYPGQQYGGGQHYREYYEGYSDEGAASTADFLARMRRFGEPGGDGAGASTFGLHPRGDLKAALKDILAGRLLGSISQLQPADPETTDQTDLLETQLDEKMSSGPTRSTKGTERTLWATFKTIPVNTRAYSGRAAVPTNTTNQYPSYILTKSSLKHSQYHKANMATSMRRHESKLGTFVRPLSVNRPLLSTSSTPDWNDDDDRKSLAVMSLGARPPEAPAPAARSDSKVDDDAILDIITTLETSPDWRVLEEIARLAGFSTPIDWRDPYVGNSLLEMALTERAAPTRSAPAPAPLPTRSTTPTTQTKMALRDDDSTTTTPPPTTTTTAHNTTTSPKTTVYLDLNRLISLVGFLADNYDYDIVAKKFNETMRNYSVPTCSVPTTTTTTTEPPPLFDINATVVAKCFVCGLEEEQIPHTARCADAFAGDFIPLIPVEARAKQYIASYRKYCRYMDLPNYGEEAIMPRSVYGRWTGGCSVRWTDLSGVYTQRTCRNKNRATTGRHFASKRMAKLEMALNELENGCIASPAASLLPLSRGISLYARFHACVCTGHWCNRAAPAHAHAPLYCLLAALCYYLLPFINM